MWRSEPQTRQYVLVRPDVPQEPARDDVIGHTALRYVQGWTEALVDQIIPRFRPTARRALNGQARRQEMIRGILRVMHPQVIVETGTHRGATAAWLATESGVDVHTAELDARYYAYARRRFARRPTIHVYHQPSPAMLASLATSSAFPKERALFYLDAHWHGSLPLPQELQFIADCWTNSVAVIDDFEVPGDPDYGFDDYGPGSRLCSRDMGLDELAGAQVYWPSAPSRTETGARRGCAVIALGAVTTALAELPELRVNRAH